MRVRDRGVIAIAVLLGVNLHPPAAVAQGAAHEFREAHLGMEVRVTVVHADAETAATFARAAFDLMAAHEDILSDWRPRSEVRTLSRAPHGEWIRISRPLRDVLALALRVARATDGAFDPTVGPLSELWREARRRGTPTDSAARAEAVQRVGYDRVDLDSAGSRVRLTVPGMRIDLGAIAKGWILDRALDTLRARGATAALVEAGGDMVAYGAPPGRAGWHVLVPRASGDTLLVLTGGAVSSSGTQAQRAPAAAADATAAEGHILDPRDGRGALTDEVVTVLGPAAAITDALATALTLTAPAERPRLAARFGVTMLAAGAIPRTDPASAAAPALRNP